MKNNGKKIISLALCGVLTAGLCVGIAGCKDDKTEQKKAESLVSIDVNPSVSLVLDGDNKVLSVIAENEDAQVLVYEENFEGMTVEEATKKIADLAVELGYLNEDNRGVSVSAPGTLNTATVEALAEGAFSAAVSAEGKNFSVNVTTEGLFSVNREVEAVNASFGLDLTVGEYELILQAQAADKSLTVQAAASLSTEQLLAIVYEGVEEYVPYATEAYLAVKNEAFSAYYKAKEELLDSLWTTPYINVLKYGFKNNGMIYSTYASASVALECGIWMAEAAAKVAENVSVPEALQTRIATALGFDEAQTAQFKEDIKSDDGKVTLDSLEGYLNTYFKNMTEAERAAAETVWNEVLGLAKSMAADVETLVNTEYKKAFDDLVADMEDMIPEGLASVANGYGAEFRSTLTEMTTAAEGKEPLAGAYAALEKLEEAKARVLETIKGELDEADRKSVEEKIANAEDMFANFEALLNSKLTRAEQQAKSYLAAAKAAKESQTAGGAVA